MPYCRDDRWHKTQEEADACVKHLNDEHFDNLSTISRTRPSPQRATPGRSRRTKRPARAVTPGSNPLQSQGSPIIGQQGEEHARNPTPLPGVPVTQIPPPIEQHDDEPYDAPPADPQGEHRVPDTPRQPSMGPGALKVRGWLDNVASDPPPVPLDEINGQQKTTPSGLSRRHVVDAGHPRTPTPVSKDITSPPRIGATRRTDKVDGGEPADATPSKAAKENGAAPAGPERAWYQTENFVVSRKALVRGGILGVLFMIAMYLWAQYDASQYP